MSEQKMREAFDKLPQTMKFLKSFEAGWYAREALSQREAQEPVAFLYTDAYGTHYTEDQNDIWNSNGIESWRPLYTAPPSREVPEEQVAWIDEQGLLWRLATTMDTSKMRPVYARALLASKGGV